MGEIKAKSNCPTNDSVTRGVSRERSGLEAEISFLCWGHSLPSLTEFLNLLASQIHRLSGRIKRSKVIRQRGLRVAAEMDQQSLMNRGPMAAKFPSYGSTDKLGHQASLEDQLDATGTSALSLISPDGSEERDAAKLWARVKKAVGGLLPHVFLLLVSLGYTISGAYVFLHLEKPYWDRLRNETRHNLEAFQAQLTDNLWLLTRNSSLSPADGVAEFQKYTAKLYEIYQTRQVVIAEKTLERKNNTDINDYVQIKPLGFSQAVLFIVATATTIGYGDITPLTQDGKVFTLIYGTVGFPLLLVLVADFAKFLSAFVLFLYTSYLEAKAKLWERLRGSQVTEGDLSPESTTDNSDEATADRLWRNLEQCHYVQIPPTLILLIVILYCCLGGLLVSSYEQHWGFWEGMYFAHISVLKIGFGDLYPQNSTFLPISIIYIFFGLVITTMCIDTVGVQYLHKIHYIGRRMGEADYLHLLQKAKARKRRKEVMKAMFKTLIFVKDVKVDDMFKSASPKEPPGPTENVYVVDVTPYSIVLAWDPVPTASSYTIRYRLKIISAPLNLSKFTGRRISFDPETGQRRGLPTEVSGIEVFHHEITNLLSFSIYEIDVCGVNKYGRGETTHLVQITEPETAPQSIHAEMITPTTMMVSWSPPLKKKRDIVRYTVYYTTKPAEPYEKWSKSFTDADSISLTIKGLQEQTVYTICIAADYLQGHAPFSRSIFTSTGQLGTDGQITTKV